MSETNSLNEIKEHFDAQSGGSESSEWIKFEVPRDPRYAVGSNLMPSSINAATTSLNEEGEKSAGVRGKQSDETIEKLVSLFRDFLEAAPNPAASNSTHNTQQNTAVRKRVFGLNKGLPPDAGSDDRYDYEQKYPRDRVGEEIADEARVWLTYLDEAESFDRERVEGWKETADVLLVFAGLFSGVITTFVSQASQSLQQDNTQVSASLLFEIAQILRAQSIGTPINMIPNSTLTPTSRFIPSTHAFLVNGLWFASLAITLSTALFAVLAKQWLYYYLSSIRGTANEKARARQLRFKGFELWGVGAIVDLLPILLHLAVGIFLTGIIILLFPLDIRVAWTIVAITGITYTLYFISVILPIRYPECPYITSLTIYVGILFFILQESLRWISAILDKGFQALWRTTIFRRIKFRALESIQRLLHYIHGLSDFFLDLDFCRIRHKFRTLLRLVRLPTIFTKEFPKFTNWREENIKKAIKNAAFLDPEALNWLYATSANRSVHRIIARCVAVYPIITKRQFKFNIYENLPETLEISEMNVLDLRYGLCLDLLGGGRDNWRLVLRSLKPDIVESQPEEVEYRSYSRIAENVIDRTHDQILRDAIKDNLELPLVMWHYFFTQTPSNATMAVHILTCGYEGLFEWESDSTRKTIHNTGVVSFKGFNEKRGWWKFDYLFGFFLRYTEPDYSLDKTFETRYLLLVSVYRNLTSDQPFIFNKEQRQNSLLNLFINFEDWLPHPNRHVSPKQYFAFFIDICCADAFWSESMNDDVRYWAVVCLDKIWNSMDADIAIHFPFTECHDLSLIYQWYSQDLHSKLSEKTPPLFTLLLVPQNHQHLCTFLLNDPDAVFHFSKCFQNLGNYRSIYKTGTYIYANLMDLLKSVNPKMPLFTVLYDSSVLVQLWKLVVFSELDAKMFFLRVKSKLDQEKLEEIYAAMTEKTQSVMIEPAWKSEDSGVWDLPEPIWSYEGTDILDALRRSACQFKQIVGVFHPRPVSTTSGATNTDHDIEERAQVSDPNERKGFHHVANWIKRAFGSVWSKTRIRGARFTSETELQDL